jgi:hypothetical protein
VLSTQRFNELCQAVEEVFRDYWIGGSSLEEVIEARGSDEVDNPLAAHQVLGLPPGLRPEVYQVMQRYYLQRHHSDKGGNDEVTKALIKCKEFIP